MGIQFAALQLAPHDRLRGLRSPCSDVLLMVAGDVVSCDGYDRAVE